MLPQNGASPLKDHLVSVRKLHEADLEAGYGEVYLPDALRFSAVQHEAYPAPDLRGRLGERSTRTAASQTLTVRVDGPPARPRCCRA